MDDLTQFKLSTELKIKYLSSYPFFDQLSQVQLEELADLLEVVSFSAGVAIVEEDQLIDSIYFIVHGYAEVYITGTEKTKRGVQPRKQLVASLTSGASIGLTQLGYFSHSGRRTATVISTTEITLLKLDLLVLYDFLKKYQLENQILATTKTILRMRFIKECLPFYKISEERLKELGEKVNEIHLQQSEVIFHQGDPGDKCYLIIEGEIEILIAEDDHFRQISILKPYMILGETTAVMGTPRTATAKALKPAALLEIHHDQLMELFENEKNVAEMFMTLILERSRPLKNPDVMMHERKTADGQKITILKNLNRPSYFKLNEEGLYIWNQLNGQNTLQDITLAVAEKYNVFSPQKIVALISKLSKSGFISNLTMTESAPEKIQLTTKISNILEAKIAFGDIDNFLTSIYNKFVKYFFTKISFIIFSLINILGFIAFLLSTRDMILFFAVKHASLFLIFMLIPFGMIKAILHELGHAFTAKSYHYEIHYVGVGWFWLMPVAFTDTSDLWLADRKMRMRVNIAGVFVDVIVASIASLLILVTFNPYIQCFLWLCALYSYISALRMLSPLQELDGYYLLMDWLEQPKLRNKSILWLVNDFPKQIKNPKELLNHKPELIYWCCCILYLIIVCIITLLLQYFVWAIFGIQTSRYMTLLLLLAVMVFSSYTVLASIKTTSKE